MIVGRERLMARTVAGGANVSGEQADRLLAYLDLLSRWSRRINLTAFDLSAPSDEAIDRLLVEPVAAASLVRAADRRVLDIGSGGGSPAIPLLLVTPGIEMTLVEVRTKKAAFLREAVRTLGVAATVEVARVEAVAAAQAVGQFDVITFRAVRADAVLWRSIDMLLAPAGRILWFGGIGHKTENNVCTVGSTGTTAALERTATRTPNE